MTARAGSVYNKGRKELTLHGGLAPHAALGRHVDAATWRRFLFPVFCNQADQQPTHKGQERKKDHEKLIIAHTLTPSLVDQGRKAHHAETFLLVYIVPDGSQQSKAEE